MDKKKKIIVIALFFVAAVIIGFIVFGKKEDTEETDTPAGGTGAGAGAGQGGASSLADLLNSAASPTTINLGLAQQLGLTTDAVTGLYLTGQATLPQFGVVKVYDADLSNLNVHNMYEIVSTGERVNPSNPKFEAIKAAIAALPKPKLGVA